MVNKADFNPSVGHVQQELNQPSSPKTDPLEVKTNQIAQAVLNSTVEPINQESTLSEVENTVVKSSSDSELIDKTQNEFLDLFQIAKNDTSSEFEESGWKGIESIENKVEQTVVEKKIVLEENKELEKAVEADKNDLSEKEKSLESTKKQDEAPTTTEKKTSSYSNIPNFRAENQFYDYSRFQSNRTQKSSYMEQMGVIYNQTAEVRLKIENMVKVLRGVIDDADGSKYAIFEDVNLDSLQCFNDLQKKLNNRARGSNNPDSVSINDHELASHLEDLAVVSKDNVLAIPASLIQKHGPITRAVNASQIPNWHSLNSKAKLAHLANQPFQAVQLMTSQNKSQLHSLAKQYFTLTTKLFILEFMLEELIKNEKNSNTKPSTGPVKLTSPEKEPKIVKADDKPTVDTKNETKAKKTEHSIMPDFLTPAQRKKERIRQDKQEEEEKRITGEFIKKKNQNYRLDQERVETDFIKKTNLSSDQKQSEKQ